MLSQLSGIAAEYRKEVMLSGVGIIKAYGLLVWIVNTPYIRWLLRRGPTSSHSEQRS